MNSMPNMVKDAALKKTQSVVVTEALDQFVIKYSDVKNEP